VTAPLVVAVTGGTGFLGRYIVATLAASGWNVRLLTRRATLHPLLSEIPLEPVLGDLGDASALRRLVTGASVIIHAARDNQVVSSLLAELIEHRLDELVPGREPRRLIRVRELLGTRTSPGQKRVNRSERRWE
jgi:uncharacterized protein YbjT (DUF2867 family)